MSRFAGARARDGPTDQTNDLLIADAPFVLPKHVRFARSLALVSGAVIGIAAGAAVFGSGCGIGVNCSGICGVYGVQPPVDAQDEHPGIGDAGHGLDASADARPVPPDGHAGGGPRPAPRRVE